MGVDTEFLIDRFLHPLNTEEGFPTKELDVPEFLLQLFTMWQLLSHVDNITVRGRLPDRPNLVRPLKQANQLTSIIVEV